MLPITRTAILTLLSLTAAASAEPMPARGTPRFLCASFTFGDAPEPQYDSTLCVTAAKGKFVKFRVTGPRVAGSANEAIRFIEAWGRLLRPGA
jgi:hypothetical protein